MNIKARNKIRNVPQKTKVCSLHQLMKNIILTAQCFALFPLGGITKDANSVNFKYRSAKTIYTIFTVILEVIYIMILLIYSDIDFKNFFSFVVLMWNLRALTGLIIFLRIARKWPDLLKKWTEMETNMVDYGNLKLKFGTLIFLFVTLGITEHSLYVCGGIRRVLSQIKKDDVFLEKYFTLLYTEFFNSFKYSHWKAVLLEFLTLISTFTWHFCDLFIALLSLALAERFQQISKKIKENQDLQWKDLRMQYNNLALLSKTLNSTISEAVLLSFFGNVYSISVTIFQSFMPRTTFEQFYFWCGIAVFLLHFWTVCMSAAQVHEKSLEPISYILSMPTKHMSYETDRLLNQIAESDVGIRGGGLFKITRSTILNVTSVILTLQLIYVQFKTQIVSNIS